MSKESMEMFALVTFTAISVKLTLVDGNSHLFINFLIRQHNWHNSDIDWMFI